MIPAPIPVPIESPQETGPQFSLRKLLWAVSLLAVLIGAGVAGNRGTSPIAVLVAFSLAIVAISTYLISESDLAALRWFTLGVISGLSASIALCVFGGPEVLALDVLDPKSRNELGPVMASNIGAILLSACLAGLCGLAGGVAAAIKARKRFVVAVVITYMLVGAVLWLRAIATHEPVDPDRLIFIHPVQNESHYGFLLPRPRLFDKFKDVGDEIRSKGTGIIVSPAAVVGCRDASTG